MSLNRIGSSTGLDAKLSFNKKTVNQNGSIAYFGGHEYKFTKEMQHKPEEKVREVAKKMMTYDNKVTKYSEESYKKFTGEVNAKFVLVKQYGKKIDGTFSREVKGIAIYVLGKLFGSTKLVAKAKDNFEEVMAGREIERSFYVVREQKPTQNPSASYTPKMNQSDIPFVSEDRDMTESEIPFVPNNGTSTTYYDDDDGLDL